jgi:cysteine desulfurase/selenocysteine lyase
LPHKFEAGTPNIVGGIGLAAAIDYVNTLGIENICDHEQELLEYALEQITEVKGMELRGQADKMAGMLSFTMGSAHPHDIGTILDQDGIAIRAGHHCAQPVMDFMNIPATARASFGLYNTTNDIDRLINGLHKVNRIFA